MTGKKVFIPTLTDVVAFPDRVPVLTEMADEVADVSMPSVPVQAATADDPPSENQVPLWDTHALTNQVWKMLEDELKPMIKDELMRFFEQQQAQMMESLGGKVRPLLAQALESKLTQISSAPMTPPTTETSS